MVLDGQRGRVGPFLNAVAKPFAGANPNVLSVASLIFAILAAAVLIIWREPLSLIIALLFILLNGFFDAIDGVVARVAGKGSKRGDLVDHVIDRFADFIIIAGISFSPFAYAHIGLVALGAVMIASYMGTQSQALGLKRDYGGLLGRAERMILMMAFLLLQYLFIRFWQGSFELLGLSLTLLDLMLAIFIVASTITALQRFVRAWRAL